MKNQATSSSDLMGFLGDNQFLNHVLYQDFEDKQLLNLLNLRVKSVSEGMNEHENRLLHNEATFGITPEDYKKKLALSKRSEMLLKIYKSIEIDKSQLTNFYRNHNKMQRQLTKKASLINLSKEVEKDM